MNKVFLVGRLTRDPELRTLPSGKPVANFVVATNEFRGNGAPERTEYHNLVAWDRRSFRRTVRWRRGIGASTATGAPRGASRHRRLPW
ncbi:MAG: single-stranded DNA-binding protein [Candidatus Limnocylindria bacterium]